jgi:hypothetical protein
MLGCSALFLRCRRFVSCSLSFALILIYGFGKGSEVHLPSGRALLFMQSGVVLCCISRSIGFTNGWGCRLGQVRSGFKAPLGRRCSLAFFVSDRRLCAFCVCFFVASGFMRVRFACTADTLYSFFFIPFSYGAESCMGMVRVDVFGVRMRDGRGFKRFPSEWIGNNLPRPTPQGVMYGMCSARHCTASRWFSYHTLAHTYWASHSSWVGSHRGWVQLLKKVGKGIDSYHTLF